MVLRRKVTDTSEKSHNGEFYNFQSVLNIVMVIKLDTITRVEKLRFLRGGGNIKLHTK
jgi:hypothetical protein